MWVRQCCVRPNIAKHLFMCTSVPCVSSAGGRWRLRVHRLSGKTRRPERRWTRPLRWSNHAEGQRITCRGNSKHQHQRCDSISCLSPRPGSDRQNGSSPPGNTCRPPEPSAAEEKQERAESCTAPPCCIVCRPAGGNTC